MSEACKCVGEINDALKEHNTRLAFALSIRPPHEHLVIATEVVEKKRGAKPVIVFPSYCPFCGTSLKSEAQQ